MANQQARQDDSKFPALLGHSSISDPSETRRILATNGALNTTITTSDSASIDAFGRWRVSEPQTLFDSKNIFDDPDLAADVENQPLFYDNAETSGTGTSTTYAVNEASQSISVSLNTAGTRVRQTKMRFNYQPGKSQLILMTFNFNGLKAVNIKREGIFDDNNGIFLQSVGTAVSLVIRTKASGSVVNNAVAQADWNIDKLDGLGTSGKTLDLTKVQILFIDYEWLGVGRVRAGFVIDGHIIYCHEFNHANILSVVYMATPNLPLRSEIVNPGTGAVDTLTQICSTVISEGGSQDLGIIRYASTAGTEVVAATENTIYAVLGMKLKTSHIGASIKLLNAAVQIQTASAKLEWILLFNPTVAGTFTYAGRPNSAVQIASGATANTVTGGYQIGGGFAESGGVQVGAGGSDSKAIDNAILLGSKIDGTLDSIVLCVRPIGGSSNVNVEGSLTWREIV
jgi:hypothetical protein